MSDQHALLHAVLHSPADNAPRLVYADWLEESGDGANAARAELIRLQVAGEWEDRQRELVGRWLPDWLPATIRPEPPDRVTHARREWWRCGEFEVAVTRGFVSGFSLPGNPYEHAWGDHTPWLMASLYADAAVALFADHPLERAVVELGEGEEYRIGNFGPLQISERVTEAEQWKCLSSRRHKPVLCWTFSRATFASELHLGLRDRVTQLGQHVLLRQQAERFALAPLPPALRLGEVRALESLHGPDPFAPDEGRT